MNSYCEKTHSKQPLNVKATEFVSYLPIKSKPNATETTQPVVELRVTYSSVLKQPPGPPYMVQRYLTAAEDTIPKLTQQENMFYQTNAYQKDSVLDIMRK
ncbi:hypothetical protein ATANTOWER_012256 [Ataeniobius toweri]|uniref:Uncharacterized protein n=1 Tax=Ataeniobius toweri TaxID=208326 RepID=A0ABU7BIB1_9TELE|nr:hypothetical protein [Ataeniobius toweri]